MNLEMWGSFKGEIEKQAKWTDMLAKAKGAAGKVLEKGKELGSKAIEKVRGMDSKDKNFFGGAAIGAVGGGGLVAALRSKKNKKG